MSVPKREKAPIAKSAMKPVMIRYSTSDAPLELPRNGRDSAHASARQRASSEVTAGRRTLGRHLTLTVADTIEPSPRPASTSPTAVRPLAFGECHDHLVAVSPQVARSLPVWPCRRKSSRVSVTSPRRTAAPTPLHRRCRTSEGRKADLRPTQRGRGETWSASGARSSPPPPRRRCAGNMVDRVELGVRPQGRDLGPSVVGPSCERVAEVTEFAEVRGLREALCGVGQAGEARGARVGGSTPPCRAAPLRDARCRARCEGSGGTCRAPWGTSAPPPLAACPSRPGVVSQSFWIPIEDRADRVVDERDDVVKSLAVNQNDVCTPREIFEPAEAAHRARAPLRSPSRTRRARRARPRPSRRTPDRS